MDEGEEGIWTSGSGHVKGGQTHRRSRSSRHFRRPGTPSRVLRRVQGRLCGTVANGLLGVRKLGQSGVQEGQRAVCWRLAVSSVAPSARLIGFTLCGTLRKHALDGANIEEQSAPDSQARDAPALRLSLEPRGRQPKLPCQFRKTGQLLFHASYYGKARRAGTGARTSAKGGILHRATFSLGKPARTFPYQRARSSVPKPDAS